MEYTHKTRGYLHFDAPRPKLATAALATDPNRVARHSFHPFISYQIIVKKIYREKNNDGVKELKKEAKPRPIKIASHADAAIFSHYSSILNELYEAQVKSSDVDPCITAFRKGGGTNIDAAKDVFHFTTSPHVIISFDVKGFFENLDHRMLKTQWKGLLKTESLPSDHFAVYQAITAYAEVERKTLYSYLGVSVHNPKQRHLEASAQRKRLCSPEAFRHLRSVKPSLITTNRSGIGIPQGSPISALLSNIYMFAFDQEAEALVTKSGGLYRRYCDDIAIVLPQTINSQEIEEELHEKIASLHLTLNPKKTVRAAFPAISDTHFRDNIQYLGFRKDQSGIRIREGSLSRYYGRMRRAVRLAHRSRQKADRKSGSKTAIRTEKLYRQYSYLMRRRSKASRYCSHNHVGNFITYAQRAAEKLDSEAIKKQIKPHWKNLQAELKKYR